jgi:hypothetical protein
MTDVHLTSFWSRRIPYRFTRMQRWSCRTAQAEECVFVYLTNKVLGGFAGVWKGRVAHPTFFSRMRTDNCGLRASVTKEWYVSPRKGSKTVVARCSCVWLPVSWAIVINYVLKVWYTHFDLGVDNIQFGEWQARRDRKKKDWIAAVEQNAVKFFL